MEREYFVMVHKGVNLTEVDAELAALTGDDYIPKRSVKCTHERLLNDRVTEWSLTEEEVVQLRKDPRIFAIDPVDLPSPVSTGWKETTGRPVQGDTYDTTMVLDHDNTLINWGIGRHRNQEAKDYSVIRNEPHQFDPNGLTWTYDSGRDFDAFYEQNPVNDLSCLEYGNTYNHRSDGTGVDILIFDDGIDPDHPEWLDENGNSRLKQVDWYAQFGLGGGTGLNVFTQDEDFYSEEYGSHGTNVCSVAAGKRFGWAKNADIYFFSTQAMGNRSIADGWDLIHQWHLIKMFASSGSRRPTVMNMSWSYVSQLTGNTVPDEIRYRDQLIDTSEMTHHEVEKNYGLNYRGGTCTLSMNIPTVNEELERLIDLGIHCVTSAGNYVNKYDVINANTNQDPTSNIDLFEAEEARTDEWGEVGHDWNNWARFTVFGTTIDYQGIAINVNHSGRFRYNAPPSPYSPRAFCAGAISHLQNNGPLDLKSYQYDNFVDRQNFPVQGTCELTSEFSNRGPAVNIWAAGTGIMVAGPGGATYYSNMYPAPKDTPLILVEDDPEHTTITRWNPVTAQDEDVDVTGQRRLRVMPNPDYTWGDEVIQRIRFNIKYDWSVIAPNMPSLVENPERSVAMSFQPDWDQGIYWTDDRLGIEHGYLLMLGDSYDMNGTTPVITVYYTVNEGEPKPNHFEFANISLDQSPNYGEDGNPVGTYSLEEKRMSLTQGTSFAAPQVAGVAALYLQEEPELTPTELLSKMTDDATDRVGFSPSEMSSILEAQGVEADNFYAYKNTSSNGTVQDPSSYHRIQNQTTIGPRNILYSPFSSNELGFKAKGKTFLHSGGYVKNSVLSSGGLDIGSLVELDATTDVTLQLKGNTHNGINPSIQTGSGIPVSFSHSDTSLGELGEVVDNGDGTYTSTFTPTASASPQLYQTVAYAHTFNQRVEDDTSVGVLPPPPQFLNSTFEVSVPENSDAGQTIFTPDIFANGITYTLSNHGDDFQINDEGNVEITVSPDFETKPQYTFDISASDPFGRTSLTRAITVNIIDVEEIPPVFTSPTTSMLASGAGIGATAYTAVAIDENPVTYGLLPGSDNEALSIDPSTGIVTLLVNPDYDDPRFAGQQGNKHYDIVVTATDSVGNSSQLPVTLELFVPDTTPPIISGEATAIALQSTLIDHDNDGLPDLHLVQIEENIGAGQVIYKFSANEPVTWSLESSHDHLSINDQGEVIYVPNPDAESSVLMNYGNGDLGLSVNIAANDLGLGLFDGETNRTETTLVVFVKNLFDSAPTFLDGNGGSISAAHSLPDQPLTLSNMYEHRPAGTLIYDINISSDGPLTDLTLIDADLFGRVDGVKLVDVTETGGRIVAVNALRPDYEDSPVLTFGLKATNAFGDSYLYIKVHIMDIPQDDDPFHLLDSDGEIIPTAHLRNIFISEGTAIGSTIYTMDANMVPWENDDGSKFEMLSIGTDAASVTPGMSLSNDGILTTTAMFDSSEKSLYEMLLRASHPLTGEVNGYVLNIYVISLDAVTLTANLGGVTGATSMNVPEPLGAAGVSSLGYAHAPINSFGGSFALVGDDADKFGINITDYGNSFPTEHGDAGLIFLNGPLGIGTYEFDVAYQSVAGVLSNLLHCSVTVTDITPPTITSSPNGANIAENSGAGQVIYTITSDDPDATYSLDPSSDPAIVMYNNWSGGVTLTTDPDYEIQSHYDFTVIATDIHGNSSSKDITLTIMDLGEYLHTATMYTGMSYYYGTAHYGFNTSTPVFGTLATGNVWDYKVITRLMHLSNKVYFRREGYGLSNSGWTTMTVNNGTTSTSYNRTDASYSEQNFYGMIIGDWTWDGANPFGYNGTNVTITWE